jgi:hypothetical protein
VIGSAVLTLPSLLTGIICLASSGYIVGRCGYYSPFMVLGGTFVSTGAGLLTALTPSMSVSRIIGIQLLVGLGSMGTQQPFTIAHAIASASDLPVALSAMVFAGSLGSTISLTIFQVIFTNKLISSLAPIAGVSGTDIIGTGATQIRKRLTGSELWQIISAYNAALAQTFFVSVGFGLGMALFAAGLSWKKLKHD